MDDQRFEGPWLLIETLNIAAIGPRLPFAPRADPGDGLLDILLVKAADREAMIFWAEHFSGPPPPPGLNRGGSSGWKGAAIARALTIAASTCRRETGA